MKSLSDASESRDHTTFLIIGAGPFGLAMSAQAQALGMEHAVVGEPMSFWKEHMPAGMLLRSGCDWHLDPLERDTIERFLETRGESPSDVEPLSLDFYLEYAAWFQNVKGIQTRRAHVTCLDHNGCRFEARLDDSTVLTADRVLLALGFSSFAHIPDEFAAVIPAQRSSHSRDCAEPKRFAGRRVLIVGGRQSAFETAALLAEAGAAHVYVCHRHATPQFAASDWTWVEPLLDRMVGEPGWYRGLPPAERESLNRRFWEEGRLKLEPWLGPRVHRDSITIRPNTRIIGAEKNGGSLQVQLDEGHTVEVDHVVYATGYQVDLERVSFLERGNLLARIERRDGFPVLDGSLQTTVPGLFMTSLPAARDFGLFFAFTAAARASARIVGRALRR
jgi:thioredoxin reductase